MLRKGYGFIAGICLAAFTSSVGSAQTASNYVAITPCRVVDTRTGGTAPVAGVRLTAGVPETFPIAGACGLPASGVLAYSMNVTAIPRAGSLSYLTVYPTGVSVSTVTSTLNSYSGAVVANAAIVPAGTSGSVNVYGTASADVLLDVNGYFTAANTSTSNDSTALGTGASNSGTENTGIGFNALNTNTGLDNTAIGSSSMSSAVSGGFNVALGSYSLSGGGNGSDNTAIGSKALQNGASGSYNVALGFQALNLSSAGSDNVALGAQALQNLTTGSANIVIGHAAGSALAGAESNDIYIGHSGTLGESNFIRIGTAGTQTNAYIAGVVSNTLTGSPAAVYIDANGQLGVQPSSERFKEDIQDMGQASDALMHLRPVTFRYKETARDGSNPLQFGLIAEEVAKIYPELIVRGTKGEIEGVAYQQLPALLLNEVQKQRGEMEQQLQTIHSLESRIAELEGLVQDRSQSDGTAHR